MKPASYSSLLLAVSLLTLSATLSAFASAPPYLTTSVTQSGAKQTTIGSYNGVLVNYTSTFASSVAFVYLDLVNSAGQTVYWNVCSSSLTAGQQSQCFVTISAAVASGNYTAWVFVTTNSGISVSASGSVKVTI